MKKELVNLSEYKLDLGSSLVENKFVGMVFDRTIMDLYYDFNQEYKTIVESRYNHTCMNIQEVYLSSVLSSSAPKSQKDRALNIVDESFWKKDESMVNLCNLKFEFLVECGVFTKK